MRSCVVHSTESLAEQPIAASARSRNGGGDLGGLHRNLAKPGAIPHDRWVSSLPRVQELRLTVLFLTESSDHPPPAIPICACSSCPAYWSSLLKRLFEDLTAWSNRCSSGFSQTSAKRRPWLRSEIHYYLSFSPARSASRTPRRPSRPRHDP